MTGLPDNLVRFAPDAGSHARYVGGVPAVILCCASFMLCCAMQRNGLIVLDTGYGWYSGEVLEGTSRFHTNPKVYGLQPVKCRHSG